MFFKKQIPNLFTLANLFSGCLALFYTFQESFVLTFFFVALGIFFDFFDGFFARLLKVESPLGLQLDSLADMVTSGVVPGFVMFLMMSKVSEFPVYYPFLAMVIVLGSAYRLAKFNIDTRQTDAFIGLPTPANALFICSLPLVISESPWPILVEILQNGYFLSFIAVLSAYMLNAEIALFSLKIKGFTFKKYQLQIYFLLFSLFCIFTLKVLAVPFIILNYVLWSFIDGKLIKGQ